MLIYILFKIIADKYQYMFLFFKLFNLIFTYPHFTGYPMLITVPIILYGHRIFFSRELPRLD